jgi:hypothetical protein
MCIKVLILFFFRVHQVAFKDSFAERLLENELHFNRLLAHNIPAHHGRRWAKILGTCRAPNQSSLSGFPDEVLFFTKKKL